MGTDLAGVFLESLGSDEARARWAALPDLPAALRAAWERARQARPGIDLPAADFAAQVAARWPAAPPPDLGFSALNLQDLYLARACLQARPGAAEVLERDYLAHVPRMIAPVRLSGAQVEVAIDRVRDRLYGGARDEDDPAGPERPFAGLASYGGTGALLEWLRILSIRIALNVKALKGERGRADDEGALLRLGESPELARLKELDGPGFAAAYGEALREAFAAISPEARAMLKMHHLDGRTLREIGKIYALSEATVSRRLRDVRQALADDIRRRLKERLALDTRQVDSLRAFLQSQLDLSLSRLIG